MERLLAVIARKQCMNQYSPAVVKTWVFLAQSTENNLSHAKFVAFQKIKANFGTIEMAKIYIEQQQDNDIEVVVI